MISKNDGGNTEFFQYAKRKKQTLIVISYNTQDLSQGRPQT